ncbi:Os02g0453300, partial [Oryza sativa Japonica Group]
NLARLLRSRAPSPTSSARTATSPASCARVRRRRRSSLSSTVLPPPLPPNDPPDLLAGGSGAQTPTSSARKRRRRRSSLLLYRAATAAPSLRCQIWLGDRLIHQSWPPLQLNRSPGWSQ